MHYLPVQLHKKIGIVCALVLVLVSLVVRVQTIDAAPNYQMNYQGKLTNDSGVAVADGTYNMRFWLLTSSSIATTSAIWTESLTDGDKVQVTNGLFSIMLGSTSPLSGIDFNQTLYLGVEIGGSTTPAWDGEMSPRKILGTVPSAFEAKNAQTVGGVASTSLLRSDADDSASGLLTFTGGIISIASSTITHLSTLISTTTMLVINGEQFTDLTGTSLAITNGALGVATSTFFTNSSQFAQWLSDETGTGNVVFSASPTFTGTTQFAGFNATNASSTYASTSVLSLYGSLYDGSSSSGTNGMVLQTTGSGVVWVATSSLGFASSDGGSNWAFDGSRLTPSSTVGVGIFASSTIGGGTGATGLTISGNGTTTGNAYFAGTIGLGTTPSAASMLSIRGAAGVNPLLIASSTGSTTLAVLTTGDLELPGQLISAGINWTARSAAGDDDTWNSVAYGNNTFVAVGSSGDIVMTSTDGINWIARSAAGNDDTWNSVAYGNGTFVAVGSSGDTVMTSPDGVTWTTRSATGNNDDLYSVTYGNGLFVAVGTFGDRVITSPDGITWTSRSVAGNNDDWYSVTYGNGRFVAVGDSSGSGDSVIYSTDGITWATSTAAGDNDTWNSVTYGNGLFVAVGYFGNRVMTSPDGVTWTTRSAVGDNDAWYGVTYGNGLFVAVGQSGGDVVMTSPDGIAWTARPAAGGDDLWLSVTYGNGAFVGVGYSGDRVMTSGKTFTNALASNNIFQGGVSFLSGPFNIGTTTSTTNAGITNVLNIASTTGTSLFTITSAGNVGIGSTSPTRLLTVNGSGYFANDITAASATITYASTTGLTASQANFTNATTSSIYATTLGTNSEYFTDLTGTGLVNTSGVLSVSTSTFFTTSAQFAQWLSDETGTGNVVFSASPTFTGTAIFANASSSYASTTGLTAQNAYIGGNLAIGTSTPQSTLTIRSTAGTNPLLIASSTGSTTLALLATGNLELPGQLISAGINWTAQSAAGENDVWNGVTYGNGLFVAVATCSAGGPDCVMTSPDGINWTAQRAEGDNDNWAGITYGNGLFVAVGYSSDLVMTSPDGVTWTTRSAAGNNDSWLSVTYGNGLFVAVGSSGDRVMTSPDGITWTARSAAGDDDVWRDVVYGNGLFVAVANSGTTRVMTSPDGITWTARSAAGDDDSLYGVTYGNGTFVAVGLLGDRVMYSTNGTSWSTTTAAGDDDNWQNVTYGNGLFVATSYLGDRVMTSPDGINWTVRSAAGDNDSWFGITYGNGTFVAVGDTSGSRNSVMTSGKTFTNALASNNIFQGGVSFLSGPFNIGTTTSTTNAGITNVLNIASTTGTSLFTITSAGNVGIGSTSPTRLLTVNGSGYFANDITAASATITYASTTGLTASQANFTNATTSSIYATTLGTNSEYFTDLTGTGLVNTSGVLSVSTSTFFTTSAQFAQWLSDETGTGNVVFSASPTFTGTAQFAGFNATNASSTYASTSVLSLYGSLYDGTSSAGTNGMVLQTTGSGVTWVATSSLGITSPNHYGPTVIVAASNASNTARAHFVADGTDDEVEIQAAIDSLPAGGGTVLLTEGTFNVGTTTYATSSIRLTSGVQLMGQGSSTRLVLQALSGTVNTNNMIHAVNASGITVRDLHLEGQQTIQGGSVTHSGVRFEEVSGSKIENISVNDIDDEAFRVSNPSSVSGYNIITHNISTNNGTGFSLSNTNHNTFTHNVSRSDGGNSAVNLAYSNYNTISNNIVSNSSSYGFGIESSTNNTISDNIAEGNDFGGFNLEFASNNTLTANSAHNHGNTGAAGFSLNAGTNNTLTANISYNNDYGFSIFANAMNNTFSTNIIEGSNRQGIDLDSSSQNTISANTLEGNGDSGAYPSIFLDGADTDDNIIIGNTISATGTDPLIEIDDSAQERNVIANNVYINSELNDTSFVLDVGTGTRFDDHNRTTLTTATEVGYNLLRIYGSSTIALASTTQLGSGAIEEWGNSAGSAMTLTNAGNLLVGTTTSRAMLTVHGSGFFTNSITAASATIAYASTTGLTATNANFTNATTSSIYATTLGTNSEYFTDLTGTGLVNTSGVLSVSTSTFFTTSAQFAQWLSDETGTGNVVFSASPTFTGTAQFAGFNATNASSTYASTSVLSLYGSLYDGASSAGTNGMILQTTGSGIEWVATSTLGITSPNHNGPTVIVAASNASNTARAHFVADGTDDHEDIQAAIDSLPAGGGTVLLTEGTFNLGTTTYATSSIRLTSGVQLMGQGSSTRLVLQALSGTAHNNNMIHAVNASGVAIRNLHLEGQQAIQGGSVLQNGITFEGTSSSTIENVIVNDFDDFGIYIRTDSNYNTLTGNIVNNNSTGFFLQSNSNSNTLTANTASNNTSHGFYLTSSNNNTLTGNIANNNSSSGFYVASSANNTLTANTANNNISSGFYVASSANNTLTANTASNNISYGFYLNSSANNTLTANIANNNGTYGLILDSTSNNNTLTSNTLEGNNQYGIYLSSSAQNTISANTLEGNGDSGAYPSIFLDGADTDDNVVIGNTISATGTDPLIEIDDSTQERNLIANNVYINSELNDTSFVLDVGTGTRFDDHNRTTLTTATEVGYNLLRIYGSSTIALASTTQLGSGAIEEWGNSAGSAMTLTNAGNLLVGTTTSRAMLTVHGSGYFENSITAASATITYASTTALTILGSLYDGSSSAGTNGMVLQTTGSGIEWVATSSLGITATGDGGSHWTYDGSRLTPSSTVGIGIFASSTIGDGTGTGGLTIAGTATTTNLKVTSLTASRALFTSADNLLTTSGLSQYLIDSITDETGTGSLVFSASPTFTGTAQFASLTASGSSTFAYASATALTVSGNSYFNFASSSYASTTGLTAQNAWIGNALTIGTSTNSATLTIYGSGTRNPFSVASTSGSTTLALLTTGDLLLPGQLISQGLNWTAGSATGDNDTWNSVIYGNGLFVAVGTSTTGGTGVMTSPDGINWTARSAAGNDDYWNSVTYGNGLFVAVALLGNDRVMTSPDGINWTARSAAGNNDSWYEVTYGNGLFVAVGDSSGSGDSVISSSDGINWTTRSAVGDNDIWLSITYGDGRFVAVGTGTEVVMYSTDSINWSTTTAAGNNDYWSSITYGNGLFVAVGDPTVPGDTIMTSPDGLNWTARSAAGDDDVWGSVTYGNGLFVAVAQLASGNDSAIIYSKDGINWSTTTIQASAFWSSITYGNGQFVSVGYSGTHRVMTSGKTFTNALASNNIFQGGASFLSGPFNIGTTTSTTNAGIANVLNIASTTGTSLFTITSAGNVGIGSTSPTRLLTVNGSGYFTNAITAASATITYASTTGLTASQANFTNATTSSIYATTLGTNSEYFTDLTGTGLVNTSGVLSVSTSTFFTTSAQFAQWLSDETGTGNVVFSASPTFTGVATFAYASTTGISGTNSNFTFASSTNASTTGFTAQNAWIGNALTIGTSTNSATLTIQGIGTTNPFSIASSTGTSLFAVLPTGYVGIGTSSPSTLLSVSGTTTAQNFIAYSTTSTTTLAGGLDVGGGGLVYDLGSGSTYVGNLISGTQSFDFDAGIVQWTDLPVYAASLDTPQSYTASIGGNAMLTIYGLSNAASSTYNNRVGIGSSTPSRFLTVAGDAYFTNNIAAASGTITYASTTGLTASQANFTNATTSSIYATTLGTNSEYFTDLTGTGLVNTSGVLSVSTSTFFTTSAQFAQWLSDETGTGNVVFSASPTFTGTAIFANASSTNASTTGLTAQNAYIGGNLAIGTSTPQSTLTIRSTAGTNPLLIASSTGSTTLALLSTGNLELPGQLISAGINWTPRSAAEANTWNAVTYGNGMYVAVSQSGTSRVMYSSDGVTWNMASSTEANNWSSVTYGNGLFVAVSLDGTNRIMTSPDGINWTARSAPEANTWRSVTYGEGLFVAVGASGTYRIMTSPDGITWTGRSAVAAITWTSVTYGNGKFVAVGYNNTMVSDDGISWTAGTTPDERLPWSVTYGNGLYVAAACGTSNCGVGGGSMLTSSDGITWTVQSVPEANSWYGVTYGNGLYVAFAYDGSNRIITSPNGVTWTSRSATEANSWSAITYGNGRFVAVSSDGTNRVMTSGVSQVNALTNNNNYQGGMNVFGGPFNIGTTTTSANSAYLNVLNIASTTGTSLFTILADGNVGIGSTSPTRLLTVNGSGYFANNITAASGTITYASTTGLSATNGTFTFASSTNASTTALTSQRLSIGDFINIGTTTSQALLTLDKSALTGSVIGGMKQSLNFTNSTLNAVYFGNESYITNVPTATSTLVGSMIRVADTSALGNTVRAIEGQAHRGTNTKGENTGLSGFGRTFGVRGTTLGDAGDTYLPAGVFAETEGTTQGNALRAYSGTITTEDLVSLFHDTSVFTGTGLQMNFGNAGGSFAGTSTAKFLDFQIAGTSKFTVTAGGTTTIGDGTTGTKAGLQIGYGGLCVDNDGSCFASTTGLITSVTSATGNSDLAEIYFSSQSLHAGEIVSLAGGLSVKRADRGEGDEVIGVVSTKPGLLLGFDDTSLIAGENSYPVGLKGRVPVKLSTENGPIVKGDKITLSSIPGVGMKAVESSRVVGVAMEDFNGERAYSEGFLNQFGDDMVKERLAPRSVERDARTQDGCYYGGGNALGEKECEEKKVVAVATTTTTVDTSREDALRELREESALDMEDVDGDEVAVGQVIMFIELEWYQSDREVLVLRELTATSTLGESEETLWDRIKGLAQSFVDGVLTLTGIKADRVEVKNELCVDGVCVTADDLRALLNSVHNGDNQGDVAPEEEDGEGEGGGEEIVTPPPVEEGDGGSVEEPPLIDPVTEPTTPPAEEGSTEESPITEEPVIEEIVEEEPPAAEPEPEPAPQPEPTPEPTL